MLGEPLFPMKPIRLVLLAVALIALATRADAAFKSARLLADNPQPVYPAALMLEGITRGSVVFAVAIDETGRVRDTLLLGYTNMHFVRSTLEVLKDWRFEPAELDGAPVPVQTELTIDYSLQGAVITANIINHFFFDSFRNLGDNAWQYTPTRPSALDALPHRVSGAAPAYAINAEKDGVRGRVQVRFYIDENGTVRLPAITTPAHPYLAERAVEAVRTWKFDPPTSHGRPALVVAQQDFEFGDGK